MAWAQETFDLGETRIARRIGSKLEGHSSNNKEKIVAQLCDGIHTEKLILWNRVP